MDAHEISMQSAVMSRGKYNENLCVHVHNSLYERELFEDDWTSTKNVILKKLLNK